MNIVHFPTTEEFTRSAAAWIASTIAQALAVQTTVTVGLCGGGTPKPVYTLLATDQKIDWKRVTFFLIDERYVPADHADSNQKMVRETLLNREAKDAAFIAPDTKLPLAECVAAYDKRLSTLAPDLVLIGMGDDGHIASLFPPLPHTAFGSANVIHTTTEQFAGRDRVGVTLPFLLKAPHRLFMITGAKKAALLSKMQDISEDASLYPAQYYFDERSTWFVGD